MNRRRFARRCGLVVLLALLGLPGAAVAHGIAGIVPDLGSGGGRAPNRHMPMARVAGLDYQGGPVLHSNRTHLVFWQPANSGLTFDAGYASLMERFLGQVAADSHSPANVYGLSGQYFDSGGPAAYASRYGGAVTASDPLPVKGCAEPQATGPGWTTCVTDAQLQQELEHVVAGDRLPRGGTDIYFIVLPTGLGTCTDGTSASCALGGSTSGFCGYHSETAEGLLYAVIPFNAVPGHCQSGNPRPNGSTADPAISAISHEHNETVTDPESYGAWIDRAGKEDGDLCITNFGPSLGGSGSRAWNEVIAGGHYFLQEEWSNANGGCEPRAQSDRVSISLPALASAGRSVGLVAHAVAPQSRIVGYSWLFGDGRYSHRRSTTHVYKRAGTYRIVLRTTDSWGNWAFSSRMVRVPAAAREPRKRATARSRRTSGKT